ncbi:signal recognition particle-docking protein FtsY [uncultured Limosilactobacillus sp.]|uniref:signal recognition particle-docking protein FtsY n=1 Tax=uncultured Limosilactobacillus sp. TaxID=2837629 RepID=UPI0025EC1130|nr:signal recognition particle-docking protein FtsY [uncultured Limosilactobacillus sp.]
MGLFDIFRRKHHQDDQKANGPAQNVEQSTEAKPDHEAAQKTLISEPKAGQQPIETVASDENHQGTSVDRKLTTEDSKAPVEDQKSNTSVTTTEEINDAPLFHESLSEVSEKETDEQAADQKLTTENSATTVRDQVNDDKETSEEKYDTGLEKSRNGFGARLNKFLANFRHVDEDFFEDLEDLLIESDVGYDMAMKLSDSLREEVKLQNAKSKQDVSNVIIQKMVELYDEAGKNEQVGINFAQSGPTVIMFVGVNGAGKTTTIGKMAARFKNEGKKVLLAAADTFRAGATEQLDVWAKRDGVDIVTGPENGDPAAVVFDGVKKAKDEGYDVLFVDTAGRLQNKVNLMNELAKMKRILTREIPEAPHEVLLVLDATTGQNALNQAKLFKESTDVTGIVLTKLDGTARGGIVLAIRNELHLPVKFVGLGEKVADLQEFDASEFVYGLFKGLVTNNN